MKALPVSRVPANHSIPRCLISVLLVMEHLRVSSVGAYLSMQEIKIPARRIMIHPMPDFTALTTLYHYLTENAFYLMT